MRTIPQRELRNHISRVLRQVEDGESVRVTVDGRPVADLVPIRNATRTFVPAAEVIQLLSRASLDEGFTHDIEDITGAAIDEL